MANDDDIAHFRAMPQSVVGIALERHRPAAALPLVGGDQHGRAAILNAAGKAVGRKAAKHDGMDRSDPGAGEHGHRNLWDHRQVDRDAVALPHAPRF